MAAMKKIKAEMQQEIEQLKEQVRKEEAEEEDKISKARAENNEASWSQYGEWRGGLQAKREETKRLEKKSEDLQKLIEEDERREAEKVRLEGGSDGLDEEADAEREEEQNMVELRRMMEQMGLHMPWGMRGGPMRTGGNGGKIIPEERHFRRMEKYDGGEGKWEKWWFELTTVMGRAGVGKGAGGGDRPDDESGYEGRNGESCRDGVVGKVLRGLFTAVSSLTTGETSTVVRGAVSKEEGKCGCAKVNDAF